MEATLTIALAGNPNVGKSTIFNALTGARQHVGNWPGKTVERREGITRIEGREALVVDLPGIYSLTAYSMEEIIARDFIIHEHPSVVVAVVDASNLERNLYLVTQLLEMETPVIIALNMSDLAERRGLTIDPETLSARLGGVPVIATVGTRCVGIDALKEAVVQIATQPQPAAPNLVRYSERLEAEIESLRARIAVDAALRRTYHARWLAIKLLENDDDVRTRLENAGQVALLRAAGEAIARVAEAEGEEPELLIADRRYLFVSEVVHGALTRPEPGAETLSDRIDHVVTHRILGLPIFLLAMWVVFQFTANVSAPTIDWIDGIISGPITHWVGALTGALGLGGSWIESLLMDGVIAGVGGVMVFVPVLVFLFIAIAVLEDSGYMARAALVMDRYMRMIGLHGKSFLPLLVGFGCTVPAVYATRTLESEDDRKLTGFLVSFMSCGARLPVYAIFGAAFFGAGAGNLVFAMYALGIGVAIATGLLIRRTVYRNKPAQPFVIELPPTGCPTRATCFTSSGSAPRAFYTGRPP
ncbi:MAG: ferrous iron transport protein B [Anaerolineae bacterium]|nr:ferrous iron transport protein B [Anaerolineae bacterium]